MFFIICGSKSFSDNKELSVETFNVLGLLNSESNFKEIERLYKSQIKQNTAPDIVLFQEAFTGRTERMIRSLGYSYVAKGPRMGFRLFNSGLFIASKYPIVDEKTLVYRHCATVECFASKGVLVVGIEHPSFKNPVYILNTHFQAQSEHDDVRKQQIQILRQNYLDMVPEGSTVVFGGDFNFKPRHDSYHFFNEQFSFLESGKMCLEDVNNKCEVKYNEFTDQYDFLKNNHDRIFYANGALESVDITPIKVDRRFTQKYNGNHLSDHFSFFSKFKIQDRVD